MVFAAASSPSASCSSCEMTSTDLCASHGGTEGCGFVEVVQGGELDKTGVLCAGGESLVGNKTSETTCEGPNKRILLVSAAFKKYNNNAP